MKIINLVYIAVIIYGIRLLMSKDLNFFVSWIKRWEGSFGRSNNDPASKYRPPGTDIHTVKGITWLTFSSNSKELGYPATVEHFLKMPDSTWWKITKIKFWDVWQGIDLLQKTKPGIAYFIADFGFNSGTSGAEKRLANYQREKMGINDSNITKKEIVRNFMLDPMPWNARFKDLCEYRISYLKTLSGWSTYGKGWTNRVNSLYKEFS